MTEQEIVKAANAYADELGLDEMDYDIAVETRDTIKDYCPK